MATIQSSIALYDNFSPVLHDIMDAMNLTITSVHDLQNSMGDSMDISNFDAAENAIRQAGAAMESLENHADSINTAVQNNTTAQSRFNSEVRSGTTASNGLLAMIKKIGGAYLTIQGMGKIIDLSDTMTQTEARLNLIVDDGGSVDELQQKIFNAAQDARADYMTTAAAISKLGAQAGDAFSGNDELIAFTTLLNKEFVNAGTSAQGIDSVMLQLTQSMAAGKLQGEELNAVLDNAAPIVSKIKTYLEEVQGIDATNIKELASEGVLTADVIKNAMFYAADEINQTFDSMPMTFAQVANSIKNNALVAFGPVLQKLNDIANSERFNIMVNGAIGALTILASAAVGVFDMMTSGAAFVYDNWSLISPVIYGVAAALAVYAGYLATTKGIEMASAAAAGVMAVFKGMQALAIWASTSATWAATTAQLGLNGAMYACPIVWIIALIIAVIAAIYAVITAIISLTGESLSATGVIVGALATAVAFIWNLFLGLLDLVLGIVNYWVNIFSNFVNFFANVFKNPISSVIYLFQGMGDAVLGVLEKIASAMDFIFGSNMAATVSSWRAGLKDMADAAVSKYAPNEDYQKVMNGLNLSTSDLGLERWAYGDAYSSGYDLGAGLADKVGSAFDGIGDLGNTGGAGGYNYPGADSLEGIANNTGATAGNTADIKDSLEITTEELKYLRDIKEREVIDRTVLKSVTIDMSGMVNKVENKNDLDGISTYLAKSLKQQMEVSMEGV